jgi:hypothetical protein
MEELSIRRAHWAISNALSFSFYYRKQDDGWNHVSVVENTLQKASSDMTWK